MPNIIIEATPRIAKALEFTELFATIHRNTVAGGHALISHMKSRLHVTDQYLMGDEKDGEFVFATLLIKSARSKSQQQAMAKIIRNVLLPAIEEANPPFWWNFCVSIQTFDIEDYLKTDSRIYSRTV